MSKSGSKSSDVSSKSTNASSKSKESRFVALEKSHIELRETLERQTLLESLLNQNNITAIFPINVDNNIKNPRRATVLANDDVSKISVQSEMSEFIKTVALRGFLILLSIFSRWKNCRNISTIIFD